MARWRAEAIERLPELRLKIASADSIMALWIELLLRFEDAYKQDPPDESLIDRIYSFADWCVHAPRNADAGHDPLTAVSVAFYEHIPTFGPAREDMPRWFSYREVLENKQIFAYHIGDEEYQQLLGHIMESQERYRARK